MYPSYEGVNNTPATPPTPYHRSTKPTQNPSLCARNRAVTVGRSTKVDFCTFTMAIYTKNSAI